MSGIVRIDGASGIFWRGQGGIVLGPITFGVNDVRFAVDAIAPDEVVHLSAPSSDALRAAAQWFADPSVIETIASSVDGTTTDTPILADAVARVATVHAVEAIHLGDLDDGVLLFDQAYAYERAVDPAAAQRFYALSSAVADRLVDEIDANDYSGPLVERVRESILAAPEQTFTAENRSWMLDVLDGRSDVADRLWASVQRQAVGETSGLAIDLGDIDSGPSRRVLADLRTLWPRVLAFAGPDEPEVDVEPHGETVDLSARLRPQVITDSTEIAGIFAVVADAATGELLAYSPTRVVDGRVHATVRLAAEPDSIHCAFIRSGTDLTTVRLDPVGIALSRIDRYCRYAWTEHRRAGAQLAGIGISDDESRINVAQQGVDQAHRRAVDAIDTAVALSRQLIRRQRNSPEISDLTDYRGAVDRFAQIVGSHPRILGATGPTMAELYAEVPW